jgi:methionyl-tRNA formyltransferase
MTRVLLFTGQDIGFEVVETLQGRQDIELFVVAERTARDDVYGYRSAIDACATRGIPCVKASRVDDALRQRLAYFSPDIIVSVYYPHLIANDVLSLTRTAAINIHPGILPYYRGKFPTPWYILNGEAKFGLAIHEIDSGVDTGGVFVQQLYDLPATITGHDLYRLTMRYGAELICTHLPDIAAGRIKARPQQGVGSYYGFIEKSYRIDWGRSWREIERRIRVHAKPYLPAHSQLFNRMIFINRAEPVEIAGYSSQRSGHLIDVRPGGEFAVSCADGCLLVTDYEVVPTLGSGEFTAHFRAGMRFEA